MNNQPIQSEKKWLKILLILVVVSMLTSMIITFAIPEQEVEQQNSWQSITPGQKLSQDQQQVAGELLEIKQSEFGQEFNYRSEFRVYPNTVTTTEDSTVKLIVEYIVYDENHTLANYIALYGEPDLVLRNPKASDFSIANVFLDEGLAIFVHEYAQTVEIKWYFEPMSEAEFLNSYGKYLTTEKEGPEAFH
jgi:flagellar basal body-associated protein FliL